MLGGWVNVEYSLFSSHVPVAVSGTWWIWSCTILRFLWVSVSQSPCDSDSSALSLSTDTWAFCPYRSAVSTCSTCNFLLCSFQPLQWHWQSEVLFAWVNIVWIGFWMLAAGFSFVFNFTTLTTLFLKQHLGGICFLWCCFGLVNTLQSRHRCVGKEMFCYWPLMVCIAASLQFSSYCIIVQEKIFVPARLYLAHYVHYWWSENFIAGL